MKSNGQGESRLQNYISYTYVVESRPELGPSVMCRVILRTGIISFISFLHEPGRMNCTVKYQ